jgi:thiol:disulfide interchange protein DsbC
MSLTKKLGVSSAFVFSALLLANAMASRKDMEQAPVTEQKIAQLETLSTKSESQLSAKTAAEVKVLLEKKLPGMQISEISPSPLTGFYQAFFGNELIYVSNNGQYIFTGNMLELADGRPINHTQIAIAQQDAKQAPMRAETIAQIDESDMVVFKAKEEKHVITVFTDVDCAYCRKLHKEVPQLNDKGITVRYMAYPRAGIGSDAYKKLVSVWCADDKMAAMDDAKLKRQFGNHGKMTCNNPIANQFNMTRKFNLSGTPTLVLSDGELIGGYLPADDLFDHLSRKENDKVTKTSGI